MDDKNTQIAMKEMTEHETASRSAEIHTWIHRSAEIQTWIHRSADWKWVTCNDAERIKEFKDCNIKTASWIQAIEGKLFQCVESFVHLEWWAGWFLLCCCSLLATPLPSSLPPFPAKPSWALLAENSGDTLPCVRSSFYLLPFTSTHCCSGAFLGL